MHWVVCPLPAASVVRIQMALRVTAVGRLDLQIVVVVDMAVCAGIHFARWRQLVRIRQRETGRGVIKIRILPGDCVMAVGAGRNRKHVGRGGMLRIRRLLPRGKVAACIPAVGCSNLQIVVASHMATRARNIRVSVGEGEADRGSRVVYGSSEPTVEGVASLAGLRELRAHVIWYAPAHGLRLLIILQVTRDTSGGKPLELSDGRAFVAIVALHCCMGSQQREAVLVILHLLNSNIPTLDGMALRAICAHFSLMHVRVAVLAILAYIRENRLHVALRAFHFFVHAAQRVFRLVVVEFRNGLDGPPCRGRVAVLARDRERAVRTTSSLPLRRRYRSIRRLQCEEQEPAQNLK